MANIYFKIGDRLRVNSEFSKDEKYILSQTSAFCCSAISLKGGNRWHDPVKVSSPNAITEAEICQMLKNGVTTHWERYDSKQRKWKKIKLN